MKLDVKEIWRPVVHVLAPACLVRGTKSKLLSFVICACCLPRFKLLVDIIESFDSDPYHMITTGGEGHFAWDDPVTYWFNGKEVSDYNFNGQGTAYKFFLASNAN
jgi:hypothetical protein